jgi:hypothetical protein
METKANLEKAQFRFTKKNADEKNKMRHNKLSYVWVNKAKESQFSNEKVNKDVLNHHIVEIMETLALDVGCT